MLTTTTWVGRISAMTISILGLEECTILVPEQDVSVVVTDPSPTPTPTATPTPSPTGYALTKAKLKTAFAEAQPFEAFAGATIEVVHDDAASPLLNPAFVKHDSGQFRFVGRMEVAGTTTLLSQMINNYSIDFGTRRGGNQYFVEFDTNAPRFEIAHNGNGAANDHRVSIDGKYVNMQSVRSFQSKTVTRITLPASSAGTTHRVRFETFAAPFWGVYVEPAYTVSAPVNADPVRALILGDSYTSGTANVAGVDHLETWAPQVARAFGWRDFYRSGIGGTGYNASPNGLKNFAARFDTDVTPFNPDVIVIAGGINDASTTLQADASALFDRIQAALPHAMVIVVAPWDPKGGMDSKRNQLLAAVGTRPQFFFLDAVTDNWLGDRTATISADGIHPTQVGHNKIAAEFISDVSAIISAF